jgi:hypothetical protein
MMNSARKGELMPNSRFDIFSGTLNNQPMWLETVEGLSGARQRMQEIAAAKPGRYFILSLPDRRVLADIETFAKPGGVSPADGNGD